MRSTLILISQGMLLAVMLLPGCKQGEGDRCNYNEDCSDELVCCVTPGNEVAGGICVLPLQCDHTSKDGGEVISDSGLEDTAPPVDSAAADAAPDQATDLAAEEDQAVTPDQAITPDQAVVSDQATPDSTLE